MRYGEDYFTYLKQMQMDENFEKIILRYEMLSIKKKKQNEFNGLIEGEPDWF